MFEAISHLPKLSLTFALIKESKINITHLCNYQFGCLVLHFIASVVAGRRGRLDARRNLLILDVNTTKITNNLPLI